MLFVSIVQFLSFGFSISSLWQNALMVSTPADHVTCNITNPITGKVHNITARNLHVFWRWRTLDIRWDFKGKSDTQLWLSETYDRTYHYRCEWHPNYTYPPVEYFNNSSTFDEMVSFEVPAVYYPLSELQKTNTFSPFELTETYLPEDESQVSNTTAPTVSPTTDPYTRGCSDLKIIIGTGKSYFSLLIIGTVCQGAAMILMIGPLCHLNSVKTRRLLKRIIIGLNTLAFMILLMAFAIWFAFFSQNINEVIEQDSSYALSVCLLGTPVIGLSIVWLLASWILLAIATMSTCYLSNRPKAWYRFLSKRRDVGTRIVSGHRVNLLRDADGAVNFRGKIIEEESTDEDSIGNYDCTTSSSNEAEKHRLGDLVNRTPSSNSNGADESYRTAESSMGTMNMRGDSYPGSYSH